MRVLEYCNLSSHIDDMYTLHVAFGIIILLHYILHSVIEALTPQPAHMYNNVYTHIHYIRT